MTKRACENYRLIYYGFYDKKNQAKIIKLKHQ